MHHRFEDLLGAALGQLDFDLDEMDVWVAAGTVAEEAAAWRRRGQKGAAGHDVMVDLGQLATVGGPKLGPLAGRRQPGHRDQG